ncbi:aldo/keto reductase [Flavobacterium johnsoniae]|jgi:predicted oxidoreductase|uniref:Predicted oxidoreductase n=2 Tax=Flavobacterium johnsoniae TaxID=986 RepID=A0A1M5S2R3_FLAJO|nr:aldo/keto reductase [Flavobacterium johnsoniae]ABQ03749.1 aldo/keto reductase [Flavobacterium johnsoniae UW101]OXG03271.1 aldo/keto reductase [Flavobacterium johnsoniae UW101]WQG79386.1 aldo/keto reductase [Flavobacterium johnsoniae UW101]SHH32730.1 Predicted oxidoreductase [Flavobacterium johnsoniae]SHK01581.1 Predicted oxidoreductase [Flavobacterium johnsoniae]
MSKTALSPIISGTMNWGVWDKNLTSKEMENMIQICIENKITTFDHADIYGDYTTEADFGKAFKDSKISREKLQLITKCGIQLVTESRKNKIKHYDYSKDYIIWSVEESLKKLKTDYVDLFLLHRPSPLMQADEIAEAVEKLKSEGKILDFGLSNFTSSQTELIRQKTEVSYNQVQFSATHYEPMIDGSLDYMQTNGIRPLSWNPLGTVFREDTKKTRRLKKLFSTLLEKYHLGADTLLLAWILKHPANVIPIAGTVNVARIQSLVKAVELDMDKEDWFAIWTESMGDDVA